MNQDAVFQAEADLDSEIHNRGRRSRQGEIDVVAATGGIDNNLMAQDDDENAPLLGGGSGADAGGYDESSFVDIEFKNLPWYKTPAIYWLLPSFTIAATAFGGVMVPKLNMILAMLCRDYLADKAVQDPNFTYIPVIFGEENPECRSAEVQALSSRFALYANVISGLLSALVSPKLGALSDRYGRTKLIGLVSAGAFFGEIITILVAQFPDTFSVHWMFLGYAFDGISGSFTAALALIHSYATDCTPPSKRSAAFGYFHACLFTGVAFGPLFAAWVISVTGTRLAVFYIALCSHVFFILFVILILPESLSKSRQRIAREKYRMEQEQYGIATDWIRYLSSLNLMGPLRILVPTGEGTGPALRRNLVLLAVIDTIVFGVSMSMLSILVYYVKHTFGWGDVESSKFLSIVNVVRVLTLLMILPLLTRILRGRNRPTSPKPGADNVDLYTIRLGIFLDGMGYIGYALASTGPLFILSGVMAAVGGVASPTLQSALTKHVPADRSGQLLGATGTLHALARVGGPLLFNGLYSLTVKKYPPATFFALGGTFGIAFLSSWFVRPHVVMQEPKLDALESDSADREEDHLLPG